MMEKYGTYGLFRNRITKEEIRVPYTEQEELYKYACDKNWEELEDETTSNETESRSVQSGR